MSRKPEKTKDHLANHGILDMAYDQESYRRLLQQLEAEISVVAVHLSSRNLTLLPQNAEVVDDTKEH